MNFKKLALLKESRDVMDTSIPRAAYCSLDLSTMNKELEEIDITSPEDCQRYIDRVLKRNKAQVAFGGYLEKRALYAQSERFIASGERNIHLGMDFWCSAGTQVIVPIAGKIHSFQNNVDKGNYGPTIILCHELEEITFYTLYGHLSLESLKGLHIGKRFSNGETLGTLGTPDINVHYAPHLHFQIIMDIEGYQGDYPGVCAQNDLDFYRKNCPDPNLLLKFNL